MSEICDGPIIWIVEKRLWYAPWKKKVIGVRVYGITIPLKQPEPDTFENAMAKARSCKYEGKSGSLGGAGMWDKLRQDGDWRTVSDILQSYGGDPLPEELMTTESFLYSFKRGFSGYIGEEDCLEAGRCYPYRIIF